MTRWKASTGVLRDKRLPTLLKGKLCQPKVRPVLLYEKAYFPYKKTYELKIEIEEM